MPLAWDVRSARLEILDHNLPESQRVLADYSKVPASLGMWSGPTPKEGLTAEIVEVKKHALGTTDVRGKLVLTSENPANIKWLLVKAGALGAVNTFTENPALPDDRQWINAWGDDGWAFTKHSTPLLCFSITPRQSSLLRKLLAKGAVRVKATVDSRYYAGSYPYVTGVLEGTGGEEVLTLAHMSEQGAHDNATGVAAAVEALGTLKRLVDAAVLPQPKRSIRVLVMGEIYGSMHYVASNPERIRRTIAAMCMDTPAGFYHLGGTEYTFYMNPHTAKDFTDALILKVAAGYLPLVGRPWHERPFTTGTDTYLAEPMVGIPTVWGYSGSGVETHHNSGDTPDRVDARSLRDIGVIDAAFLYYIANAGESEAGWLARLAESRGYGQILNAADSKNQPRAKIAYSVDRESQAVLSVLRLVPQNHRPALREALQPMLDRLRSFGDLQSSRLADAGESTPAASGEAGRIVVQRRRFGTLPLDDLPHDQRQGFPSGAWAIVPTIALYWCDGHRTLAEVIRLTTLELGPSNFDFVGYFKFLRTHGYVTFARE
ncbi:MAG TPA: M28 family peptidase [Bryobacteraceae bacterium]|nr:M28 family peptidase [Bryobacteraceae bacterium]